MGGYLFSAKLKDDLSVVDPSQGFQGEKVLPIFGVFDLSNSTNKIDSGSILVYGDSYCVESSSPTKCFPLITEFLKSLSSKVKEGHLYADKHRRKYTYLDDSVI